MRKSLVVSIWLLVAFLITCFASPARATTYFVTAGDDLTLSFVLSSSSPCSVIIINQPVSGLYSSFSSPVTLAPNNSGTKIMAAPGEVAEWDVPGNVFTVLTGTLDVILENLVITGLGGGAGVHVMSDARAKLINDQITCKDTGVLVDPAGNAEIEGSRLLNNVTGVMLADGKATVERTQVRNNRNGIVLNGHAQVKVWYSMIDDNTGTGVMAAPGSFAVLNNNDISFNGADGVFYAAGSLGSVSFNTVTFNSGVGLNNPFGALVNATPGNNTVAGQLTNVVGIAPANNQIGP